jgi:kinesin family protein C1
MVRIKNVKEVEIGSFEAATQFVADGTSRRMTRKTAMNDASSRSHLIFSMVIAIENKATKQTSVGKLSFIDLAGSE